MRPRSNDKRSRPFPTEPDKGRNVVERSYASFKQRRGLATGYDKLAVVFRSAARRRRVGVKDTPAPSEDDRDDHGAQETNT